MKQENTESLSIRHIEPNWILTLYILFLDGLRLLQYDEYHIDKIYPVYHIMINLITVKFENMKERNIKYLRQKSLMENLYIILRLRQ